MDPSGAVQPISASVKYYRKNRDAILAREREKKRWLDYYERNKEAVRLRQKEAYARKKALVVPAVTAEPTVPPPT
jgi:hypothetical protein